LRQFSQLREDKNEESPALAGRTYHNIGLERLFAKALLFFPPRAIKGVSLKKLLKLDKNLIKTNKMVLISKKDIAQASF